MWDIFVNLTCINRTPVFPNTKSWSLFYQLLCWEYAGVGLIYVRLTKISYSGTFVKVWFIQESVLFRFIQESVLFRFIQESVLFRFIQESVLFRFIQESVLFRFIQQSVLFRFIHESVLFRVQFRHVSL
jgi:hypothetical protein